MSDVPPARLSNRPSCSSCLPLLTPVVPCLPCLPSLHEKGFIIQPLLPFVPVFTFRSLPQEPLAILTVRLKPSRRRPSPLLPNPVINTNNNTRPDDRQWQIQTSVLVLPTYCINYPITQETSLCGQSFELFPNIRQPTEKSFQRGPFFWPKPLA